MPRYINNYSLPVYFRNTVFTPNTEVETLDVPVTRATVVSTIIEPFVIATGSNDVLLLKFNNESAAWTTVTLTAGSRTAAQIASDINTVIGTTVASSEGGKLKLVAPVVSNINNSVFINDTGSTAAATIGLSTDDINPIEQSALQCYVIGSVAETYNITSANNTFIFKFNNSARWITATLTIGATQTADDIVNDINLAYSIATGEAPNIALAVDIDLDNYIKLIAPIYDNFKSQVFIKSTGNTALAVLGFNGDNFNEIISSQYPTLIKTSDLPIYNPIINEWSYKKTNN